MPVSKADAKGKWLQTVWEVDDAPRYQGISNWVNIDGKTYWENTADAPLPRREYTKRKDYQIMKRGNKIVVNNNEWTQINPSCILAYLGLKGYGNLHGVTKNIVTGKQIGRAHV